MGVSGFMKFIDNLSDREGKIFAFLIYPMWGLLVFEVVMRYGLDRPTIWSHELCGFIYGTHLVLGGAYALRYGAHVNVDILYNRFPLRTRAILDLVTWILFYILCAALIWKGGAIAWRSVSVLEHSDTVWGPPIWPIKLVVPLGTTLMALQGVTKTIRDIYTAMGREARKPSEGQMSP